MKISAFSENIVTREFRRRGEVLNLQINIDVVTPEYLDAMDARAEAARKKVDQLFAVPKRKKKIERSELQLEKELLVLLREVNASSLCDPVSLPDGTTTSLLRDWDMVEDDGSTYVECSRANVVRLPPRAVQELLDFCLKAAKTVKKTDDEEGMSESMRDGSSEIRLVAQNT